MKKILILMMVGILAFTLIACDNTQEPVDGNKDNTEDNTVIDDNGDEAEDDLDSDVSEDVIVDMTLEEIIDKMYELTGLEFPSTMKQALTDENMLYMLGVDNFKYLEGLTSEPMMTSQAHSIVLFTVEADADIETIMADIKANVDGRKWICVGVEEENILVDHVGNHIVLIMDQASEALMDAFMEIMN